MNKKLSKEISARTTADSSTKADDMHVSPAIAKPNVACRFGSSHRFGVSVISWYVRLFDLSFENELRLIAKWLTFIYGWSPFSKCQRLLFPKRWKLFWLRFWNSPISLFFVAAFAILLSLLIVYLSTNYIMK